MIGVAASPAELRIAAEFFELFRTPGEPIVAGRRYSAVLSTSGCADHADARLLLAYGSAEQPVDREAGRPIEHMCGAQVQWGDQPFPVHGRLALFSGDKKDSIVAANGRAVDYKVESNTCTLRRVGYDLFAEVSFLLTEGQPAQCATTPTLEWHIALLRQLLLDGGMAFVEIPRIPYGVEFICCLTHDIDFFGIRRQKLDQTLAGFVIRASLGTLVAVARGRRTLSEARQNLRALLILPFVFLRVAADLWNPFKDYAAADGKRPSTFFLVPFKQHAGVAPDGRVNRRRACAYDVLDISREVLETASCGNEIAVHGIDAWRDSVAGQAELARISGVVGRQKIRGVRMHWLYFGSDSPRRLEAAGFDYDSTCGFNDAVGYRAGTSQAFCAPGTDRLIELPLLIMDTALFYPGRMNLTRTEAWRLCRRIVTTAARFGGTVVINWHDRSLAPERLWGAFYAALLAHIERRHRVWFATAADAVDWLRWRRAIRFTTHHDGTATAIDALLPGPGRPDGILRTHRPGDRNGVIVEDERLGGSGTLKIRLQSERGRPSAEVCRT